MYCDVLREMHILYCTWVPHGVEVESRHLDCGDGECRSLPTPLT